MNPADAVAHLHPEHWARANRLLVRKALAEFAHERLLTPASRAGARAGTWSAATTAPSTYRFAARRLALDHWQIDADSITRHRDGDRAAARRPGLLHRAARRPRPQRRRSCRSTWRRSPPRWPAPRTSSTEPRGQRGRAGRAPTSRPSRPAMTEGHPCFVANNGRLGFGVDEYHGVRPGGRPRRSGWSGWPRTATTPPSRCARRPRLRARCSTSELGAATRDRFAATLTGARPRPGRLPAHPRAPVAVVEQARRHLRRRARRAAAGAASATAPTSTWRSSPSAPSSTSPTRSSTT